MDFSDALRALKEGKQVRMTDCKAIRCLEIMNNMIFALTIVGTCEYLSCVPENMIFSDKWEIAE